MLLFLRDVLHLWVLMCLILRILWMYASVYLFILSLAILLLLEFGSWVEALFSVGVVPGLIGVIIVKLHLHRVVLLLLLQLLMTVLPIVFLLQRHTVVIIAIEVLLLLVAVKLHISILVVALGFRPHLHCIAFFLVSSAGGFSALRGLHYCVPRPLIDYIVVLVLASAIGRDSSTALHIASLYLLIVACIVVLILTVVIGEMSSWEALIRQAIRFAFANSHCELFDV